MTPIFKPMTLFQSILIISILLTIDAQWYIKKSYRTNGMVYPNPGKRSLPDREPLFGDVDCSIPYSQLHSYQKAAWICCCDYETTSTITNQNFLPTDSNSFQIELPPTLERILLKRRSVHVVPPYFNEYDQPFNRFSKKLLRRFLDTK
jgi:hypothetical protein